MTSTGLDPAGDDSPLAAWDGEKTGSRWYSGKVKYAAESNLLDPQVNHADDARVHYGVWGVG